MEKHTYGRDWYDYITDEINRRIVEILNAVGMVKGTIGWVKIGFECISLYLAVKKLPWPTKENTNWLNTHRLIEIRDEFLSHENNSGRRKVWAAIFNVLIIKYDYDPYYRKRIDWIFDMAENKPDNWNSHAYRLKSDQWWKE